MCPCLAIVGKIKEDGTNRQSRPVSDEDCIKPMIVIDFEQLDEGVEGIVNSGVPEVPGQ